MQTLAVELSETKAEFYTLPVDMPGTITVGKVSYSSCIESDMNGFYDWLRDENKQVIGVRMMPLGNEALYAPIMLLSDVHWDEEAGALIIYFDTNQEYIEEYSADQDFGNNKILRSISGTYLISFNIDNLTPHELSGIQPFCKPLEVLHPEVG